MPDGTLIWKSPSGHTYVTTPGSALLFPALCTPTGDLAPPDPERTQQSGERTAMMPQRRATRTQNHTRYIASERRRNRQARQARHTATPATWFGPAPPAADDDDPPPF